MKKTLSLILIVLLAVTGTLFAQGASEKAATPEVYFLNFKPEIATVYTDVVAPAFEAETGIKLKVVTAASNQYATTLKSEMATSNPPVIFQTNGPVGLQGSRADVAPLENTEFYGILADKSMALSIDGHVAAIPYAVEGYGIIYNQAIMNKYFALPGAKVTSMDQIKADWAAFRGPAQELDLPSAPKQFLHYFEEENRPQTRLDRNLEHGMAVSIGRLRPDTQYDYKFVCLSHNTLRGAAGGAVLLAELLCAKGYIQPQ